MVIEGVQQKLPHYLLPLFPPLAMLSVGLDLANDPQPSSASRPGLEVGGFGMGYRVGMLRRFAVAIGGTLPGGAVWSDDAADAGDDGGGGDCRCGFFTRNGIGRRLPRWGLVRWRRHLLLAAVFLPAFRPLECTATGRQRDVSGGIQIEPGRWTDRLRRTVADLLPGRRRASSIPTIFW